MSKKNIIISCDTTIALSKEEIEKRGLYVIPLNAIADGVEYHDTVDIDANKLGQLMRNGAKVSTSTPTIVEIEDYFDNIFKTTNADVIIHFTISSKLSSMFSLFTTVCNERYGDKVIVVDSLTICYWIDQQVTLAKHLVETTNMDEHQIVEEVKKQLIGTGEIVFIPSSLEYLRRGGRISPAVATIANLIGVLPVLTFKDGVVGKKGVTRTARKACLTALNEWEATIENFKEDYDLLLFITDDSAIEAGNKLAEGLKDAIGDRKLLVQKISLNVIAHAGPGTFGLGYSKKIKM